MIDIKKRLSHLTVSQILDISRKLGISPKKNTRKSIIVDQLVSISYAEGKFDQLEEEAKSHGV